MVFSSLEFLFAFLPILCIIYFLVPKKFRGARNIVLLAFSLFFYWYGEPKYLVIMLASILANYAFGLAVHKKRSKAVLALAVAVNIGILIYFKYTDFILSNVNRLFHTDLPLQEIIMPIGISFFTFQGLSYVFDVYYGKARVQKNPLNVALYISLFPQLIAGPIVRYETVAEEINLRHENRPEMAEGIRRFIIGLGKKMLLANPMGLVADTVFAIAAGDLTTPVAWVGALAYTLQIYFDFSGYSDMAIGLGKMFGFHFLENFNYPYISKSITEFWRRWHISLGTWFRDYIYIPLGGNRRGPAKHLRNIFLVWLLTGVWHGAAWNFVAWGLYFFAILMVEKYVLGRYLNNALGHIYALLLIILGWVIFRSESLSYAASYIGVMFGQGGGPADGQGIYLLLQYKVEFILAAVCSLPVAKLLGRTKGKLPDGIYYGAQNAFVLGVLALSVICLINSTFNPFIYFRF